jgi:hypothetical protein
MILLRRHSVRLAKANVQELIIDVVAPDVLFESGVPVLDAVLFIEWLLVVAKTDPVGIAHIDSAADDAEAIHWDNPTDDAEAKHALADELAGLSDTVVGAADPLADLDCRNTDHQSAKPMNPQTLLTGGSHVYCLLSLCHGDSGG